MSLALMDSYNPTVQALQRKNKKLRAENNRLKAENKLYAAEMSAAKENGFYSAQELFMAYQNAEEELAEAKKDAERYRYFCEHLDDTDQTNPLHILLAAIGSRAPTKQELDAAIDDIIDAMKGK